MNKAKLKVLVQALKEIVDELESEMYADEDVLAFTPPPEGFEHWWDTEPSKVRGCGEGDCVRV